MVMLRYKNVRFCMSFYTMLSNSAQQCYTIFGTGLVSCEIYDSPRYYTVIKASPRFLPTQQPAIVRSELS